LRTAVENGPGWVIDQVTASGLRGRGGAAFPTGIKWRAVAEADDSTESDQSAAGERAHENMNHPGVNHAAAKQVIANADESEPGTFTDRVLMELAPFAVVESLTISGFAVGATQGWIYV